MRRYRQTEMENMNVSQDSRIVAKPFVKWAGGKGALINELVNFLPRDFGQQLNVTYIEPFVGGGAMLFHMLTHYPNIKRAIINDVNEDLINCYLLIKTNPDKLIASLKKIQEEYYQQISIDEKSEYYYKMRDKYNEGELSLEDRSACFIFLNKTCYNGLYRVNANGEFNVPFGKYKKPNICDEELIMADHEVLQKVDIYVGEYRNITKHLGKKYNFIYMDPPYRPLSGSACFIEYTCKTFDDVEQERLKEYCDALTLKGCKIMQSNSNSIDNNGEPYFTKLYNAYRIDQIRAHRFINTHVEKREKETELLIMNY